MKLGKVTEARLNRALNILNQKNVGYPILISQYGTVSLDLAPFLVETFHKWNELSADGELVSGKEGRKIHVSGLQIVFSASGTTCYLKSGSEQISATVTKDFNRDVPFPADLYECKEGQALNLEYVAGAATVYIDVVGWYE